MDCFITLIGGRSPRTGNRGRRSTGNRGSQWAVELMVVMMAYKRKLVNRLLVSRGITVQDY
jgi:hypothetical protein